MAQRQATITLRLSPATAKTLRALNVIADTLTEVHEDMPWRDDVAKAVRAMRYVTRHLEFEEAD